MSRGPSRLRVVGIGPGGADQLTVEAAQALREVEVFLVPDKGVADLVALRTELLARHAPGARLVQVPDPPRDRDPADYEQAVEDWHDARAAAWEQAMLDTGADVVGMLVWGDPSLYDSTLRIVERVLARGRLAFDHDVVPGVTAIALLAARHRTVLHRVGEPVLVTTGRRLAESVATGATCLVVMLDGDLALRDLGPGWDVWWGANLGTSDERLVAGTLPDVVPEIEAARAAARSARGWVMDTYLLHRHPPR